MFESDFSDISSKEGRGGLYHNTNIFKPKPLQVRFMNSIGMDIPIKNYIEGNKQKKDEVEFEYIQNNIKFLRMLPNK